MNAGELRMAGHPIAFDQAPGWSRLPSSWHGRHSRSGGGNEAQQHASAAATFNHVQ
jgi:hypothetical protein